MMQFSEAELNVIETALKIGYNIRFTEARKLIQSNKVADIEDKQELINDAVAMRELYERIGARNL